MKKTLFCIISIIIIIVLVQALLPTPVFAVTIHITKTLTDDDVTSSMQPNISDSSKVFEAGNKILGIIQTIGYAAATIMLIVIAIRFLLASASEKAMIKEQLTPYVIGVILLFAMSTFLTVANVVGHSINGDATISSVSDSIKKGAEVLQ